MNLQKIRKAKKRFRILWIDKQIPFVRRGYDYVTMKICHTEIGDLYGYPNYIIIEL